MILKTLKPKQKRSVLLKTQSLLYMETTYPNINTSGGEIILDFIISFSKIDRFPFTKSKLYDVFYLYGKLDRKTTLSLQNAILIS